MLDPANNRTCIGIKFFINIFIIIVFLHFFQDINECEMWDECDQSCSNINGSYSCSCRANFTLEEMGHCKHQTSN